jgi:hypothetical protein
MAAMSDNIRGTGFLHPEEYSQVSLSQVVIEADKILVCVPVVYKFGEQETLLELKKGDTILGDKEVPGQMAGRLILVDPKERFLSSPVVLRNKKCILFLKKLTVDGGFQSKYKLDKSDQVFKLGRPWESSLCLDFSTTTLAKNLLTKKYGINDPNILVDVVKKLSRWRTEKCDQEAKIKELVLLLNATKGQAIYEENILPILTHLGVKVLKKGDEFLIQRTTTEEKSP